jgi:hypothetical protein
MTAPRFRVPRPFIQAFIVFHIVAIVCWSFPLNSRLVTATRDLVAPYMLWSGMFQNWDLFSPEPFSLNAYLVADITYQNGDTSVWKFPMPQYYGYFRRYLLERDRKWSSEGIREDSHSQLWPDAARYIARLNNRTGNRPVNVKLVRYYSQIEVPEPGRPKPDEPWKQYVFFSYDVQPGDLQ